MVTARKHGNERQLVAALEWIFIILPLVICAVAIGAYLAMFAAD